MSGAHDWRYDGLSPHNGEYWYKCAICGATDWIASYGTVSQLMPEKCPGALTAAHGKVVSLVIFDEPVELRDGDTVSFNQSFHADGTVTTTKPVVSRAQPELDDSLRLGFGHVGPANARHAVRAASAEPYDYRPVSLLKKKE